MSNGRYKRPLHTKDSQIPWLGDIPAEWELKRFKNLFRIQKRIAGKLGFDVLSITQKGIRKKDTVSGDGQLSMDYSKYQIVKPGDFAMNSMDLLTGFVDISRYHGVTSPDYRVFTLEDESCDPRYQLYLLQLCYIAKIFYPLGQGAAQLGRWRLPTEAFSEFVGPVPPLPEQTQIAKFLDHETAKIDRLIEKQEALIRLLKEKRQAMISHAVTKGLNPHAPLKDSGIKWLGQVPAHWSFGPLKRFWDVIDCKHVTVPFLESGFRIASVMEVRNFELDLTDAFRTSEEFYRLMTDGGRKPQRGDIIYCRNTANTGTSAYVHTDEPFAMGQDVVLIKSRSRNGRYLNYVLHGDSMSKQLDTLMVGSTFKRINVAEIRMLSVPCPPSAEQDAIVAFIEKEAPIFERLIGNAERAATLLRERRTALISAAVTGKIDVRHWQPSTPSESSAI